VYETIKIEKAEEKSKFCKYVEFA